MPDLGKYAVEVYAAYAVSLALLAAIGLISWRQSRKAKAELDAIEARKDG